MSRQTTETRTPQDRSTEFVPVQGGSEGASAGTLLVAAYAVMWAVLLGFVLLTWRRLSATDRRLSELDERLRKSTQGR